MGYRKHILVVARFPVGGIRTYFRYMYSQAVFESYEFTFLMPNDGELERYLSEHCPNLNLNFVDSGSSNLSFLKCLKQELNTKRYSLIHSHGYTAGAVSAVALVLLPKAKHLMTAHDVFLNSQFLGLRGKLKQLAMSFAFSQIDTIHAVSEDCKSNFLEFFPNVSSNSVKTILHGVDTERFFNEAARDFRRELGLQDQLLFGFFGRFMAQKGFRYIVEAVEQLVAEDESYRNKFRVMTFGWGGFIREEFEALEQKGLSEMFIQMPHTDNMPAAVKGVEAVLMPSLWEACGLLGMEALASGTPIIGANCIGLREVLEGSPAIIVPPRDSAAIAKAIVSLLDDNRKSEFAEYAAIAKDRFALDKPAFELEQLYQELMGCL